MRISQSIKLENQWAMILSKNHVHILKQNTLTLNIISLGVVQEKRRFTWIVFQLPFKLPQSLQKLLEFFFVYEYNWDSTNQNLGSRSRIIMCFDPIYCLPRVVFLCFFCCVFGKWIKVIVIVFNMDT